MAQFGRRVYIDDRVRLPQALDGIGEILRVRPDDDGLAQRRDFHGVRSAHRHKRSADHDHVGQAVELAQFPHGVAEHDAAPGSVRRRQTAVGLLRALEATAAFLLDEPRDFPKPLRFSRHDDQLNFVQFHRQRLAGVDHHFFFARTTAAQHDERAVPANAQRRRQFLLAIDVLGDRSGIPFQGADHVHALGRHTGIPKTLGDLLILSADPGQRGEHPANQWADQPQAPGAARREPPVGHTDFDASAGRNRREVIPHFQFHQHNDRRPKPIQRSTDHPTEIERIAKDLQIGIQRPRAVVARVGGRRNDNLDVQKRISDLLHQRAGRVDFAH